MVSIRPCPWCGQRPVPKKGVIRHHCPWGIMIEIQADSDEEARRIWNNRKGSEGI